MRKLFSVLVVMVLMLSMTAYSQSLGDIMSAPKNQQEVVEETETEDPGQPSGESSETEESGEASDVAAMRARIVEIAGAKVGLVKDQRGDDGFRIGWQHMIEFYQTAYQLTDLEKERPQWVSSLKSVGGQVNSWCGIFDVWAWMKAGLPVHWNTRVVGCKYRGDKAAAGPGDIVILKLSVNPYNHHAIIKSIDGDRMVTIDGNQGADSIKVRDRKLSDVEIFYSVADAMGQPVAVKPGNPGSGQNPSTGKPSTGKPSSGTPSSGGSSGSGQQMTEKEIEDFVRKIIETIMNSFGFF
ncbi:MAG: hypothetical protein AB1403_02355 [Candidatus Riflebacteria bacterium]